MSNANAQWPFPNVRKHDQEIDFVTPDTDNTKHMRVVYFFNKEDPMRGGVTVGYSPILHDSKGYPQGILARVAVAYCKEGDSFCRKTGRKMVTEMLEDGKFTKLPIYMERTPVLYLKSLFTM